MEEQPFNFTLVVGVRRKWIVVVFTPDDGYEDDLTITDNKAIEVLHIYIAVRMRQ